MKTNVQLVDCTLRDGAFLKNFAVTLEDTEKVINVMEAAGVDYVEVGHGFGIGGGRVTGTFVATDEQYADVATRFVNDIKWGVFSIGEWCKPDEVTAILQRQPDYIKIGMDPARHKESLGIMEQIAAKKVNPIMFLMKTYAWQMSDILEAIAVGRDHGSNTLYLVDSAGTMTMENVSQLCKEIFNKYPETQLGFHAHNNLGLAVANSLVAVQNGATMIDCSLLGVGRSGGNCSLEQFIFTLLKCGHELSVDPFELLTFSRDVLPGMFPLTALSPLDIVVGYSGFHSSFYKKVSTFADRYEVPVERLIVAICEITKVAPTDEQLEKAVQNCLG